MSSEEIIKKMAITCKILNDVLRDSQKYTKLKRMYKELEKNGKMHKMNDLYNLCEEFDR